MVYKCSKFAVFKRRGAYQQGGFEERCVLWVGFESVVNI